MGHIYCFALLLATFLLSGCGLKKSLWDDDGVTVANPMKIHDINAGDDSDATYAAKVPVDDYYNALKLAKTVYTVTANNSDNSGNNVSGYTKAQSVYIVNYIDEGIGLVNAYCRRWFQNVEELNRMLAYQYSNTNIISQIGTVGLGIAGANTNIVTGYGALNTALSGFYENYNSSFMIAPNTSSVQEHIVSAMAGAADEMRKGADKKSFKQAYDELEAYANLCTHAQAKQIVNSALQITKTKVDATTQQAQTSVKSSIELQQQFGSAPVTQDNSNAQEIKPSGDER